VNQGDTIFDVGANIGYFSLLFASLCPHGSVHSFEPVPLNFHLLCMNRLLNGFSNLRPNQDAVGEVEGQVDFVISADSAFSSLIDTSRKQVVERAVVDMTTLDAYCERHKVARIDLLKVDVEGAEARVLAGAAQLLKDSTRRPRTIMLELFEPMLERHGSSIQNVLDQMHTNGYRPFVASGGQLVPFTREHYNRFYNVAFIGN